MRHLWHHAEAVMTAWLYDLRFFGSCTLPRYWRHGR